MLVSFSIIIQILNLWTASEESPRMLHGYKAGLLKIEVIGRQGASHKLGRSCCKQDEWRC
jgi:hypothetical protein